jgi:hypothetical protein
LTVQFIVRDDKLHVQTSMRSNDVVLGIPYDWWMMSRLGISVASSLGVDLGSYTHVVGSMHLYDRDLGIASDVESIGVLPEPRVTVPPALTHGTAKRGKTYPVSLLTQAAENVVLSRDTHALSADFTGADWYLSHVPPLVDVVKCIGCHCVFKVADMYEEDPDFCRVCG